MTAQERAEHLDRVQAREQAEREQRAGWKGRGLTRPVDPRRK